MPVAKKSPTIERIRELETLLANEEQDKDYVCAELDALKTAFENSEYLRVELEDRVKELEGREESLIRALGVSRHDFECVSGSFELLGLKALGLKVVSS